MRIQLLSRTVFLAAFLSISFSHALYAQGPDKFNYQSVVRNSNNEIVVNKVVKYKISILRGSPDGTTIYSETHSPSTNQFGLISIQIGTGVPLTGLFSDINWDEGPFFLRTDIDRENGNSYSISGTVQLLSVPYALYANSVDLKVTPFGDTLTIGKNTLLIPGISKATFDAKLKNGLVAYWPLDGNADDVSGNANHGIIKGCTDAADRYGKPAKCYSFNGASNYITVKGNATLNIQRSISITAWINADADHQSLGGIIDRGPGLGDHGGYYVRFRDWKIDFAISMPYTEFMGGDLKPSTWHFFAATYDDNTVKIYLDGSLVYNKTIGSGNLDLWNNEAGLTIGIEAGHPFKGKIDDVRLYNRELSSDEVAYIFKK
jgi:Concanavalin A-like lectin/glucanases superfamily